MTGGVNSEAKKSNSQRPLSSASARRWQGANFVAGASTDPGESVRGMVVGLMTSDLVGEVLCCGDESVCMAIVQQLRGQTICAFQVRCLETTLALRESTGGLASLLLHPLHLHALGNLQFEGVIRQRLIHRKFVYR